jgi:hypothetical protein
MYVPVAGVSSTNTVSNGTNLYRTNQGCNCNTNYEPICINGIEFTNACFAQCYAPVLNN